MQSVTNMYDVFSKYADFVQKGHNKSQDLVKGLGEGIVKQFVYNPDTKRALPNSLIYPENRNIVNPDGSLNMNNILPVAGMTGTVGAVKKSIGSKSLEQIIEESEGFAPGLRAQFDRAMLTKDADTVRKLLPQIPDAYKVRFVNEIDNLIGKTQPMGATGLNVFQKPDHAPKDISFYKELAKMNEPKTFMGRLEQKLDDFAKFDIKRNPQRRELYKTLGEGIGKVVGN